MAWCVTKQRANCRCAAARLLRAHCADHLEGHEEGNGGEASEAAGWRAAEAAEAAGAASLEGSDAPERVNVLKLYNDSCQVFTQRTSYAAATAHRPSTRCSTRRPSSHLPALYWT